MSSPFQKALVAAYFDRKNKTARLRPIDKSKPKRNITMSESKRRLREQEHQRSINADKWWTQPLPIAGEECTPHQQFLADDVNSYTGIYRNRFTHPKGGTAVTGDYHTTPRKASTMLLSRSYQELTIPKRSADFRNEVGWRIHLRTGTPSDIQRRIVARAAAARAEAAKKTKRETVRHEVVDSVNNLLHFYLDANVGSKKVEEEHRIYMEKIRRDEEQRESQRLALTAELKRNSLFKATLGQN